MTSKNTLRKRIEIKARQTKMKRVLLSENERDWERITHTRSQQQKTMLRLVEIPLPKNECSCRVCPYFRGNSFFTRFFVLENAKMKRNHLRFYQRLLFSVDCSWKIWFEGLFYQWHCYPRLTTLFVNKTSRNRCVKQMCKKTIRNCNKTHSANRLLSGWGLILLESEGCVKKISTPF